MNHHDHTLRARVDGLLASIVMGPGHPIGPQNDENSCFWLLMASPSIACRLAAKILLAGPAGASHRDWAVIVIAASGQKREDDPRDFVGERYSDEFEPRGAGLSCDQLIGPAAQGVVMPLAVK